MAVVYEYRFDRLIYYIYIVVYAYTNNRRQGLVIKWSDIFCYRDNKKRTNARAYLLWRNCPRNRRRLLIINVY